MKRNVKWIFLAAIAVISIGAYAAVLLKPVEASAEQAVKGKLESQFTVSASILPVSGMVLNSVTAGNVSEIPYLPGMEVKEGEILLKTDTASQTTLDIQREQFKQQLSAARQEYDRLYGSNGSAAAALKAAESEYRLAKKNYDNGVVLAQQGGSSISLFIDHFVNRRLLNWVVPTALFQSVNAIAVMAAGVVLAWLMRPEGSVRSVLRVWLKFSFGLLLMGGGFMLLALNARHGAADGQASMGMMVAGLAMMGFAELFIDPVAMAQITRLNMPGVTGVLTGIYMLATGAVANWLAGVVAQQTTESQISDTAIAAYQHFFAQMGEWTLGCVAVMVIIAFAAACSVGKRRAAAGEITGGGA